MASVAIPSSEPTADTELLEMRVANARADLAEATEQHGRILEKARQAREKNLEDLSKARRTAQEALATAEQALRRARQLK
jgi:hypothetical protein